MKCHLTKCDTKLNDNLITYSRGETNLTKLSVTRIDILSSWVTTVCPSLPIVSIFIHILPFVSAHSIFVVEGGEMEI